ncbi:transposase, partial [Limosilactobacillus fermentum]|uniref:transposase n=1 Tax=Limosilactobacillus fermentum TaxID=1613 RepID=UPI0016512A95
MNQFNKDIIAALSSDKDITLNEVLRRQIEVTANQFLQNELTAVLGYEPHTRIDRSKDDVNYRNGTYTRTIDTEYGEINLTIPRDRLNKFQNALFPPYVRRTDGLEEMVIKMYSKGVTTREIADMVERMYHFKAIRQAENLQDAKERLAAFRAKRESSYKRRIKSIVQMEDLLTFFSFQTAIRQNIYSTNLIESFNKRL